MACGKPVIGSKDTGMEEIIIHKKNGLLVKPTIKDIQKASRFILKDRKTRDKFCRSARETAVHTFNEDKTIDKIFSILNKINRY